MKNMALERTDLLKQRVMQRITETHNSLFSLSQKRYFFCEDLKAAFILAVYADLKATYGTYAISHQDHAAFVEMLNFTAK